MLKITLHDSARKLCFQLEGKLSGAWVGELRQCWQTARSTTRDRATVLDLGDVDFVDPPGESLLADMYADGVRIQAATPLIRALVQDIEQAARCATVEEKPAQRSDVLVSPNPSARNAGAV